MKPELRFEEREMTAASLGNEACIPDLVGNTILQNDLDFHLDEDDEIFEAYGKRTTSYPYRQYHTYNRKLIKKQMKTAVLENDHIKAVFLPELGGRLWELTDKATGKNLLYTNDVIRFSNLAVRNAWFSGGVEWNIGIIGHTPLTTEQLYTARLLDEEGNPVLRMYEYERVRGAEYQMDFWLGEQDTCLNCRMRITNSGSDMIPMYWWSNMAVPEYEGGRIVVPAEKAYTTQGKDVYKVDIPVVDGRDITRYKDIPRQVDYFFDIPDESVRFIANLDKEGYGLFHLSTKRLRSRKLFSWGNNRGSDRWQSFLTEKAGRYVEIQAGLGKTQYGCIPMPPHSAWEWMEQYGPVSVGEAVSAGTAELKKAVEQLAAGEAADRRIEETLRARRKTALAEATLLYQGSGYGALKRMERALHGEKDLAAHLEFSGLSESQNRWWNFLETGIFPELAPDEIPGCFMCDRIFYDKLKATAEGINRNNWYAQYHLGVMLLAQGDLKNAERILKYSLSLTDNPWTRHALAALGVIRKDWKAASEHMTAGLSMRISDFGYIKEGFRLLLASSACEELIELYGQLSPSVAGDSRILFDFMLACSRTGRREKALDLLKEGFILDDMREGEDSISDLWKNICSSSDPVPDEWNYYSL